MYLVGFIIRMLLLRIFRGRTEDIKKTSDNSVFVSRIKPDYSQI